MLGQRCIIHEIPYNSSTERFRIYVLSDVHLGNVHCNEKLLRAAIHNIETDERAYWLSLGDLCDNIAIGDTRYDVGEIAEWLHGVHDIVGEQRDKLALMLQPIGNKCLGLIEGNHEITIYRDGHRDTYKELAAAIGASKMLLGPEGFVRLKFKRYSDDGSRHGTDTFTMYLTHGYSGGRTKSSKAGSLAYISSTVLADVVLVGHSHDHIPIRDERWYVDGGGNIKIHQMHCIICPTMVGGEMGQPKYARRKNLQPTSPGIVVLEVSPRQGKIKHRCCDMDDLLSLRMKNE